MHRSLLLIYKFAYVIRGHCATSRKVAGSSPDEGDFFNKSFQSHYGVDSEMSTRDFCVGKGLPARKPDNLTAICEPIV
jgi:hypothetical protein